MGKIAPNLLKRDFRAVRPNSKLDTDITEFKLLGQKLYLSPILDWFNGEIISYTLSRSPNFHQVAEMLRSAFQKIPDHSYLILHSDQGWQYQMSPYQKMLKDKGSAKAYPEKAIAMTIAILRTFLVFSKPSSITTECTPIFNNSQESYPNILNTTIIEG